jgi:tRNA(fMet)-specific endonuclease VapC
MIYRRRDQPPAQEPEPLRARYVLDANVSAYVIRNRPAAPRERFDRLAEAICVSTPPGDRRHDTRASRLSNGSRSGPSRLGTPSGAYDMLISAHWGSEGPMLVLNNVREFQRISGLRVDYWV